MLPVQFNYPVIEALIQQEESRLLLEEENTSDDELRATIKRELQRGSEQLRNEAYLMQAKGYELSEIANRISLISSELRATRSYSKSARIEEKAKRGSFKAKIRETADSFSPFFRPIGMASKDPYSIQEGEMVTGSLLAMHIAGRSFHLIGAGIAAGVGALCKATPTTERVCQRVAEIAEKGARKTLEATNTKEPVKQALQWASSCDGSSVAKMLVDRYQVEPTQAAELGRHVVSDLGEIAGAATAVAAFKTARYFFPKKASIGNPPKEVAVIVEKKPPSCPTAKEINTSANGYLYFPPLRELDRSSIKDLHAIWSNNQTTLVGLVAANPPPVRFGFHGTGRAGMEGLISMRTSISRGGEFLWVAGYLERVNPVAQLADLLSAAQKASDYVLRGGGMFVLRTKTATSLMQTCARPQTALPLDSMLNRRVLNLMQRDGASPLLTINFQGKSAIAEDALINVDVMHLPITPENYPSVVAGWIPRREFFYPERAGELQILSERFRLQQAVASAFQLLEQVDLAQAPWSFYRDLGRSVMSTPKKMWAVSLDEFLETGITSRSFPMSREWTSSAPAQPKLFQAQVRGNQFSLPKESLYGRLTHVQGDMHLHLFSLEEGLEPHAVMQNIVSHAQMRGAKRLFVEMNLEDLKPLVDTRHRLIASGFFSSGDPTPLLKYYIDLQFSQWVSKQYAVAFKRPYTNFVPTDPHEWSHIFQIY